MKFKAFLTTKKGKPVDRTVSVILRNKGKDIELTRLAPYRPGGYKYQFFLHDSLHLRLDRNYPVRIRKKRGKEYISGSFRYEDYELRKISLSIRTDKDEQFRRDTVRLFVKGTDENDLSLMDARLEVLLTPGPVHRYLADHLFVPDTLLFLHKKLSPAEETEIVLSDSAFPKANFTYTIQVRMLTSDNETLTQSKEISYYYRSQKFDIALGTDSIRFEYLDNGHPESREVSLFAEDLFGNKTPVYQGLTPCRVAADPYYSSYTAASDSISGTITIADEPSLLQCFSERTPDSVHIMVINPRKLPFTYSIYKKNRERSSGYADSLNHRERADTKQNYYVSIRYLWGGRVQKEDYKIPLVEKKLNISVRQPRIVYPGQKTRIDLLVTDITGAPVEGVDITAYSLTKKFRYAPPGLPDHEKTRKEKNVINNFSLTDFDPQDLTGIQLDYDAWKILAGIDSIEYFRFLFPGDSMYRFEYRTRDPLTQFAPFVVSKGAIIPVHVIYVDSKPVYFSWSVQPQPYSFRISSGIHRIKLRTSGREIVIDSVRITGGKKLIFSIDRDSKNRNIHITEAKNTLSDYERHLLYRYIVPFRNNFGDHYAYLEQKENIQLLNPHLTDVQRGFAGPFSGDLTFHLIDSFSLTFGHEPFFEYEFRPSLLKMRCIDPKIRYPGYLNSYYISDPPLADVFLTEKALRRQWKEYIETKRYNSARYRIPSSTGPGKGRLLIRLKKGEGPVGAIPLNILVFRYDNPDFLRVYPGNTSLLHDLSEGYYRLLFFYPGAGYHTEDSLFIRPDGLNYYAFRSPDTLKKDSFSIYVSDLIEKALFTSRPYYVGSKEKEQIHRRYRKSFTYTGSERIITGYVRDASEGDPLPGVTVIVKGTTYGTVTDADGYYEINVPPGHNTLIFSYIGYDLLEKTIGNNNVVDANITPTLMAMDEVVVTGYGTVKRSRSAAVVPTATAPDLSVLQGKVAGITLNNEHEVPVGIFQIQPRGANTPLSFDKSPLILINGNVYTGDLSALDPSIIRSIRILKDEEATALYGARGANGVVLIETQPGTFRPPQTPATNKGAGYDEAFLETASQASSIRHNFSDYAFWQPDLVTDKEGKASFEVVFPDDITGWRTFYLAMGDKLLAGQTEGLIHSYKPLMARLALPRFMVQGDRALAIGKVLNYSPDTVEVETKFEINGKEILSHTGICENSLIDTLPVTATSDSLTVKYFLRTKDGYFDGEERDLPVFPAGLEETRGSFYVLDEDTSLRLSFDTTMGKATVYARADILKVVEDEISHLIRYKYSCNEQLASKLKALIAEKNIATARGDRFRKDNEIEKFIRLLKKNRTENGLWGWWRGSKESLWISLHVLEALTQARELGFSTGLDEEKITELLVWEMENAHNFYIKVRILKILTLLDARVDYVSYLADLEKETPPSLNALLNILRLKQLHHIHLSTDTLRSFRDSTLFGNVYYSDSRSSVSLLNNDIQNTLLAYRILRADSTTDRKTLRKIRNYFLEERKHGYWRNTYESSLIIETILPDLLKNKTGSVHPVLTLSGDTSLTVSEFPFEMQTDPDRKISITRSGAYPIYLTSWQKYWDPSPVPNNKYFGITTSFDNDTATTLKAGQKTKLVATVTVKKDADYVMINIPVPGGCSYASKKNYFRNESYREYYRNETTIFCDHLSKGQYTFEIELIPRYTGTYTLNPAKVELMYFPTFYGNNESKKIKIK